MEKSCSKITMLGIYCLCVPIPQWFRSILTAKLGRFYKLFFEPAVFFFLEKDRVKIRPVLKQAWPGQKLRVNTKLKYLVHVGENLMFIKN